MICDPEFLLLADALVGGIICLSALDHLRRMNRKTRESIRWAFISLAVGAFLLAVSPLFRDSGPHVEDLVAHVGIAALLLTDRRRPTDCALVDDCDAQQRHPGAAS